MQLHLEGIFMYRRMESVHFFQWGKYHEVGEVSRAVGAVFMRVCKVATSIKQTYDKIESMSTKLN